MASFLLQYDYSITSLNQTNFGFRLSIQSNKTTDDPYVKENLFIIFLIELAPISSILRYQFSIEAIRQYYYLNNLDIATKDVFRTLSNI